jgi:hypothetical protein
MTLDIRQSDTAKNEKQAQIATYAPSGAMQSSSVQATLGVDVYRILRELVRPVLGVTAVRVLAKAKRGCDHHKVFIMTSGSDIDRDRKLVDLMGQLDSVDYDLVPVSAAGMVPDGAQAI